jgi:glycolate dehydrogenase FAD-linked subunit
MTTVSTAALADRLRRAIGTDNVLAAHSDLLVYECDGFVIEKNSPDIVAFPRNTQDVVEIVRLCNEFGVPFIPRGAGTSLAGGCLPVGGGVMIVLTRMKQILEINLRDRYAVVQPGVVNLWLTNALKGTGYHFAPDPSSQGACTIGGNVATNSGGPHTLKYGVTVNHVLGVEGVLADGRIVQFGGPAEDPCGLDLVGAIVGSEGTLAIVTKVWVRLTKNPQGYRTLLGVFESCDDATNAISEIIGAGIVPAALEMMDQGILVAVEAAFQFGFPLDAQAILLIEVDGLEAGLDEQKEQWCREPGCPTSCEKSPRLAIVMAFESSMCFMPATEIFIRSCCLTSGTQSRCDKFFRRAMRFSKNVWPAAAASPASTELASKRSIS